MKIIGRIEEIDQMKGLISSNKAELLAVYGRRRIGKTYLIKNVFEKELRFEFTGTQNASLDNQLFKFFQKIETYFPLDYPNFKQPKNWAEAFGILRNCLSKKSKNKPIIFFDELSWIASKRSNFLEEFAYWWNDWAANQQIVVVICGSAASWMLNKVINNKGGLHNRVTKRINLKPFTLAETKLYLENLEVKWDDYQIIQFYMAVGGVPTYLQEVKPGETVTQTIDRLFFGDDVFLQTEFNNLYAALFTGYQNHISVIRLLSEKWQGLSRQDIIHNTDLKDGGALSHILEELESSAFILKLPSKSKKQKDFIYRLSDEYSMFYLKFIEKKTSSSKNEWLKIAATEKYKIWCGYAFENVCIKHVESIKMALGISGIYSETSSFAFKGTDEEQGFQLDLLIERADNAINLCEMKFSNDDYRMTEEYANHLRKRREVFRRITKTKKMLFNTLITTYGINHSKSSAAQIDHEITMDKLFILQKF